MSVAVDGTEQQKAIASKKQQGTPKKLRANADKHLRALRRRFSPEELEAIISGALDDCHSEKIGVRDSGRNFIGRYVIPYVMPSPEVIHKINGEIKHGGIIGHAVEIHALLANPDYVDYLRERSIAEDCNPGDVRQICQSGNSDAVANGAAHGETGPRVDGDRDGGEQSTDRADAATPR